MNDVQTPTDASLPMAHRRLGLSERLFLVTLAVGLAILVRWPLSVSLWAVPMDPNSPLHILALEQIASGGSWTEISNLAFPTPVPIRMVALPTLLLGAPLAQATSAMAALNLATTGMLAIQGLSLAWLAGRMGWGTKAQVVAIAAGVLAPVSIHVQALGQQENLGFLAMALAVAGASSSGRTGWTLSLTSLFLAGFSSPYQAVPTGILLVSTSLFHGREALKRSLLCAVVVAMPVLLYYTGASTGEASVAGIATSPPEEGYLASAGIVDMLWPRSMWDGQSVPMDSASMRIEAIQRPLYRDVFHSGWPWSTTHQSAYLGSVLLLGLWGLYRARKDPVFKGVLLGSGICLVFAMGPSLRLFSEVHTVIPLPWAALSKLPGLSELQATHRFLSGLVFALALGLAWSLRKGSWAKSIACCLLLLADGLLRAPVHWPLPAGQVQFNEIKSALPDGPVMLWPPLNHFSPQYYEMMAVLLERPVGIYSPNGVSLTGEIRYSGPHTGHIRMDLVRKTGRSDQPFEVLHATTLPSSGPFEVKVEVNLGKVDIIVFIDKEGNGPDPNEPIMVLEDIRIGFENVGGLEFKLYDPGITQEQVDSGRDLPLKPGTQLPDDLPARKGDLHPGEWLLFGAQGGSKAILRTVSKRTHDYPDEDLEFRVDPRALTIGEERCVSPYHCIQPLTLQQPLIRPIP